MLPGLGQVYQRRFVMASVVFTIFTAMQFYLPLRAFLPLVALVASFEAFLRGPQVKMVSQSVSAEKNSRKSSQFRNYVFSTIAVIGFLGWMSFASMAFLPVGASVTTKEAADHLAKEVKQCAKLLGRYPAGLSECPSEGFDPVMALDSWGRPYHYQSNAQGFEIRSLGPDGVLSTRDDYRFTYR